MLDWIRKFIFDRRTVQLTVPIDRRKRRCKTARQADLILSKSLDDFSRTIAVRRDEMFKK